jgi:hypothetical protein
MSSLREQVELHLIPDLSRQVVEGRIWWRQKMVHAVHFPLQDPQVHC